MNVELGNGPLFGSSSGFRKMTRDEREREREREIGIQERGRLLESTQEHQLRLVCSCVCVEHTPMPFSLKEIRLWARQREREKARERYKREVGCLIAYKNANPPDCFMPCVEHLFVLWLFLQKHRLFVFATENEKGKTPHSLPLFLEARRESVSIITFIISLVDRHRVKEQSSNEIRFVLATGSILSDGMCPFQCVFLRGATSKTDYPHTHAHTHTQKKSFVPRQAHGCYFHVELMPNFLSPCFAVHPSNCFFVQAPASRCCATNNELLLSRFQPSQRDSFPNHFQKLPSLPFLAQTNVIPRLTLS